jgi:hypothetical protein
MTALQRSQQPSIYSPINLYAALLQDGTMRMQRARKTLSVYGPICIWCDMNTLYSIIKMFVLQYKIMMADKTFQIILAVSKYRIMMLDRIFWSVLAVLRLHQHDDARQNFLRGFGCYDIKSA